MKSKLKKGGPKTVNTRSARHILTSEKALLTLLIAVSDSAFIIDPDGIILWTNPATDSMFSGEKDKLAGQSIYSFLSKDNLLKYINKIIKTKKIVHFEDIKKGIWKEYFLQPVFNKKNDIVMISVYGKDITKRKEAEEALKSSESFLNSIINQSPHPMWISDRHGTLIRINQACLDLLHISEEEVIGKYNVLKDNIVEEQGYLPLIRHVYENGETAKFELKYNSASLKNIKLKQHTYLYLEVTVFPVKNAEGKITNAVIQHMDITERKFAEEKLQKANETLRAMLEAAPLAIFDLDEEGLVRNIWNPAAERMLGWSREEVVGRFLPSVQEDAREEFKSFRDQIKAGKTIMGKEILRRRKDGSSIEYSLYAAPLFDGHRNVVGNMAILMDITERKRTEESLHKLNETLRALFYSSPLAIIALDTNGKVTQWNPASEKMFGWPEKEVLGKHMPVIPEDKIEEHISLRERALHGEAFTGLEIQRKKKDGTLLDISLSTAPLRDSQGRVIGIMSVSADITERKRAVESLLAGEERFKHLVESITDYIYTVRMQTGSPMITSHGPGCVAVTGYTSEEYAADPYLWFRMVHEEDRQAVNEQLEKMLSGEDTAPIEHRIIHKNGTIRWVKNAIVPKIDDRGHIIAYDGLISDVTERKLAEEALRLSEEKYRDIFERAVEGIFQSGVNGKFINVNPSFAHILGYESPAEVITKIKEIKDQLVVNPEDHIRFMETIFKQGKIEGFEHQFFRKDGSKIWLSTNAQIVRNREGKILYYEGIIVNISGRKQAEEEKDRLQSQLRQAQKMEAIGTFVGGIAHDFNNILSVLIGYANLLHMELDKDNTFRTYVEQILSSSEKAANLTKSLLSFSRKQPIIQKPVNLNCAIKDTEKLLKRLLTEDISLEIKLNRDNIIIMGDSSQIDQILFNLATNSRDAMPKGGKISISTSIVELDKDFITILGYGKPGKYALISFSDNGTGMDEKTREQIFDPFFTTKEVGKGTGLGMSTVYAIIKQHNGYISVYSEPGLGTAFHIYFPVITESIVEEKRNYTYEDHGKETILVAEDNESVRLLIKTVLTKYGYTVIEAKDGEDVINKFIKYKNVDMIIIDSVMPKKNGREVYDEIIKINTKVKVLFSSGYTKDVVLDKGIEEKEVDFIAKPLTPSELLKKVREVLDGK